ncbi:MAG: ASCH domain-containing protein [Proteobacteria bacterium]|nr:ASCH domain-containing protein [Pseudomonadota bacterium]
MHFIEKLRAGIERGEITTTIRIWQKPRVKPGGTYTMGAGHVRVTDMRPIAIEQITPKMARDSGFDGVIDLLKTARHGHGEKVYFITFEYREGPPMR